MTLSTVDRRTPVTFGFRNNAEIKCGGLRDSEPPGIVKVFRANADGSKGEFLRYEYPE